MSETFRKTWLTTPSHDFSPHKNAGEILDSHSDLRCRRWHPAKLRGRSVSSAFPCISFHNRAEGTAGVFQRGKVPGLTRTSCSLRKRISQKLIRTSRTQKRQRTASLGDLAEPIYYSKHIGTSSTRVFASQKRSTRSGTILEPETDEGMEFAGGACRFRVEPLDYRFPNSLGFAIHSGFAGSWVRNRFCSSSSRNSGSRNSVFPTYKSGSFPSCFSRSRRRARRKGSWAGRGRVVWCAR
jgi:hypothetical protein